MAAWVKPFCSFKKGVKLAYAWEPVIFCGGRKRASDKLTKRDFLAENISTKRGVVGAKPERFCFWIFELLNAQPSDDFHDLFPGSGSVMAAWKKYKMARQNTLIGPAPVVYASLGGGF